MKTKTIYEKEILKDIQDLSEPMVWTKPLPTNRAADNGGDSARKNFCAFNYFCCGQTVTSI